MFPHSYGHSSVSVLIWKSDNRKFTCSCLQDVQVKTAMKCDIWHFRTAKSQEKGSETFSAFFHLPPARGLFGAFHVNGGFKAKGCSCHSVVYARFLTLTLFFVSKPLMKPDKLSRNRSAAAPWNQQWCLNIVHFRFSLTTVLHQGLQLTL